ncbi:heme ABC transporter ATP-binding protein [Sinobaca sp. H24]|uniref:heme ABC transporter ATP-binding protein n=1 Tax=Sinobaca sp. H24 TaxID=2923376 RepID=UPI00207AFD6F|nr:heme ABC transporter ATP-binding protein [Sinobaca sp. H24]
MLLNVHQLTAGYGGEAVIKNISLAVKEHEIFGIIGPNGSGKSTLLKCMYRGLPTESGAIEVEGRPVSAFSNKELAKRIAVLPQHTETTFSYTARQVVELGRYPHQGGWFNNAKAEDKRIVDEAMQETKVEAFADLPMETLSGGEKQRVLLARALAQEPQILLLDEPTNHLDISHQMNLLNTLREWTSSKKITVVAILHDLNMAAMFCDRLMLLHEGRDTGTGKPGAVLKKDKIEQVYSASVHRKSHPAVPSPLITLTPKPGPGIDEAAIDRMGVERSADLVKITSGDYWKTFSSSIIGEGFGWHKVFVNRHVALDYNIDDARQEYIDYMKHKKIDPDEAVGMMTAARLENGRDTRRTIEGADVWVMATAGVSNALDASRAYEQHVPMEIGTINIWIFIDGRLPEAAFAQVMMTATEAKTRALLDRDIKDAVSGTMATGTSTDSLMVAATQKGMHHPYGGTATVLGRHVAKAVYDSVYNALEK